MLESKGSKVHCVCYIIYYTQAVSQDMNKRASGSHCASYKLPSYLPLSDQIDRLVMDGAAP